jgi:hypothetical protein
VERASPGISPARGDATTTEPRRRPHDAQLATPPTFVVPQRAQAQRSAVIELGPPGLRTYCGRAPLIMMVREASDINE